jgi:hypothetical protein
LETDALGDAGHAHCQNQFIDAAGADPADPRLLNYGHQRLFDHLRLGLEEAREVGPGPQLGDLEIERADPGIQRTVAVAVAPGGALAAALVAAGADQAVNVGLHDQLHHALGNGTQKISVAALRSKLFNQ